MKQTHWLSSWPKKFWNTCEKSYSHASIYLKTIITTVQSKNHHFQQSSDSIRIWSKYYSAGFESLTTQQVLQGSKETVIGWRCVGTISWLWQDLDFIQFAIGTIHLLAIKFGVHGTTIRNHFKVKHTLKVSPDANHHFLPKRSWPRSTRRFGQLSFTKQTHFSSKVTIRFRKRSSHEFPRNWRKSSTWRFTYGSVSLCGSWWGFLCTKSI